MAAPADTVLTALQNLHIQRKNSGDVKCLHFYKLTKDNKVFYLFGTNHSISLEKIPSPAREHIKATFDSSDLILTEGLFIRLTKEEMEKTGYFKNKSSPSYWEQLTEKEKSSLEPIIKKIKARHQIDFNITDLSIPAMHDFIMRNLFEAGVDTDVHIQYHSKIEPLDELNSIQKLEQTPLSELAFADTLLDLKEYIDSFFFNSEHKALWDESVSAYFSGEPPIYEDEEQAEELKETNSQWLAVLSKHLNENKKKSVAGVLGTLHLYHDFGFLAHFAQAGYSIERMSTDGNFTAYVYDDTKKKKTIVSVPN